MPLITVDQDRLDVAHFDNGSNWNQRMYRSLTSTIQRTTTTTTTNGNSNIDNAQHHQPGENQLQRSQSYVLAHLNSAEEEDMSVMTIDTAFRTSSINNSNLVDTMNMSGGGGGGSLLHRSSTQTSRGSNMSIMSISEVSPQNQHNAQFNLKKRQPQHHQHHQHQQQHRRNTLTTGNTSKSASTNISQPSRYSTQTYSNRSTIRSSIHSAIHNASSHSSSGSTSQYSVSGSVVSVNGSGGSQRRGRHKNRVQDRHHSLSYNSTRSRSKAVAIYPQPKTRRRHTTLPVDLDTSSSTGEGSRKEDGGEGTTTARERRRTTLGVGEGDGGTDDTDPKYERIHNSQSSSRFPSLSTPSSKTPRAGGRIPNLEHTTSSKTLTTSNHSYPTATSSITTAGGGGATARTPSPSTSPIPPSPNPYNERIEGEIVHLSYELATTKTNLDQANMLIRDYKRQAVQFQALVETLQDEISGLKTKLAVGNGTYIRSDISTVEEGTSSIDELLGSSNGSATQIAGGRSLTATTQQRQQLTEDSDVVANDDVTSRTIPTTSALQEKTKASHNNSVAIVVGTSGTTTTKHDNHNHHNEQQHNHLRVSPVTASTIRRPAYTADEIDAMVEDAAYRRRQSMDTTLSSIGEGENTNVTSHADIRENCPSSTNTTSSTGAHRSAAQAGGKTASERQQQQQIPQDHSHPSVQSDGDQVIAEDTQGRQNQRQDRRFSTTTSRTMSKPTKKDDSVSGETSAETTDATSRGGEVGSDSEIFTGDPFATVNGYNDDGLEILDQIASVLNYDLVKSEKVDNDKYDMLAPHNSDYKNEYKLAVSSVWTSLFRRREESDAHSKQRYQQPVKKHGVFGF